MVVNQSFILDEGSLCIDVLDNAIIISHSGTLTPAIVTSVLECLANSIQDFEDNNTPWGLIFHPEKDFKFFLDSYHYLASRVNKVNFQYFTYICLVVVPTEPASLERLYSIRSVLSIHIKLIPVNVFMNISDALHWVMLNLDKT